MRTIAITLSITVEDHEAEFKKELTEDEFQDMDRGQLIAELTKLFDWADNKYWEWNS